jgi:YbbR domain-containing protein
MKKSINKNWTAKLAALALAIAIWYLINLNLDRGVDFSSDQTEEEQ